MKRQMIYTMLAAGICLLIPSCGEPEFDAAKPKESFQVMQARLSPEKKKAFQQAAVKIGLRVMLSGKGEEGVKAALDGKTAEEIIEMARKMD